MIRKVHLRIRAAAVFLSLIMALSLAVPAANGLPAGPTLADWVFVDGNGSMGLNVNPANLIRNMQPVALDGKLYVAFWEQGFDGGQPLGNAHVKVYDGKDWTLIDGDGGLNFDANQHGSDPGIAAAAYDGDLYLAWVERSQSGNIANQLRVKKYDTSAGTWSFVDGGAETGLNYNTSVAAFQPALAVYDNALYAAWTDNGGGLHVKKYDSSNDTWSFVDGGTAGGLKKSSDRFVEEPVLAVNDGKLYLAWDEQDSNNVWQIRVREYDGSNWSFVDGNNAAGLNKDSSQDAEYANLAAVDGQLYLTWEEKALVSSQSRLQVRVSKYAGNNQWEFIDGGGATGLNQDPTYSAQAPYLGAFDDQLYVAFTEVDIDSQEVRVKKYDSSDSSWSSMDGAGAAGLNKASYLSAVNAMPVEYDDELYVFWNEVGTNSAFQLRAAKYAPWAIAHASHNSVSSSAHDVSVDTPVTLTAVGDRQAEEGTDVGDERYIPTSWSSTESGKSGTFSASGGAYTSEYVPTAAGSYTVTAEFAKWTWDGSAWTDSGRTDTKTVALNVNAAPLTYKIAAIPDQTLSALATGYASGKQQTGTISVANTGTGGLQNLLVSVSGSDFAVTQPLASALESGAAATTFTIAAKDGLPAGVHTATVTVSADNMTDVTFTVTQTISRKGDINGDGLVTPADALYVTKYNSGKITLTPEEFQILDMNGDDILDSQDTVLIMQAYLAGN